MEDNGIYPYTPKERFLHAPLHTHDLPTTRLYTNLRELPIHSFHELLTHYTESGLLNKRNFGTVTLHHLRNYLNEHGCEEMLEKG